MVDVETVICPNNNNEVFLERKNTIRKIYDSCETTTATVASLVDKVEELEAKLENTISMMVRIFEKLENAPKTRKKTV